MRSPKDFFKPLAIGAPEPVREIPFRPSRMIHFFDPSNAKMAAKVGDLAKKCDVLLGNLEDAISADKKIDAREGLVKEKQAILEAMPGLSPERRSELQGKLDPILEMLKPMGI